MNIYKILESLQRVEESAMAEADQLIQDIVNGRVDIYDVYAHPEDPVEKYVSGIIHKYYDEIVIDTGLHAKDDFEPILDRVIDQLQHDYNVEFDESMDNDDYEEDEGDYQDDPAVHAATKKEPLPDHVLKQIIRNPEMRADIIAAHKRQQGVAETVKKSTGPKFTGYWKGTDKGTPGNKMVGGAAESIDEEWENFINEYGATGMSTGGTISPGSAGTATTGQQSANSQQPNADDQAKQTAVLQKNLQNLKTKVPGLNINKATQALNKADANQALDNQDEKTMGAVAPQIANIVKNPQLAGQFKQLIDKSEQQEKQNQQKQQQQQPAGQQTPAGQQQQGSV